MIPWFHRYCETIEDVSGGCEIVFVQSLLSVGEKSDKPVSKYKCPSESVNNELRGGLDLTVNF